MLPTDAIFLITLGSTVSFKIEIGKQKTCYSKCVKQGFKVKEMHHNWIQEELRQELGW